MQFATISLLAAAASAGIAGATILSVNHGCVIVNGSEVCHPQIFEVKGNFSINACISTAANTTDTYSHCHLEADVDAWNQVTYRDDCLYHGDTLLLCTTETKPPLLVADPYHHGSSGNDTSSEEKNSGAVRPGQSSSSVLLTIGAIYACGIFTGVV